MVADFGHVVFRSMKKRKHDKMTKSKLCRIFMFSRCNPVTTLSFFCSTCCNAKTQKYDKLMTMTVVVSCFHPAKLAQIIMYNVYEITLLMCSTDVKLKITHCLYGTQNTTLFTFCYFCDKLFHLEFYFLHMIVL
jgi:hypothetical protein